MIEFGLAPHQVERLTPYEFKIMMKTAINRRKCDAELQRNVILNALINATRKQSSFVELFRKEKQEKSVTEILKERNELFEKSASEIFKND